LGALCVGHSIALLEQRQQHLLVRLEPLSRALDRLAVVLEREPGCRIAPEGRAAEVASFPLELRRDGMLLDPAPVAMNGRGHEQRDEPAHTQDDEYGMDPRPTTLRRCHAPAFRASTDPPLTEPCFRGTPKAQWAKNR